MWTEVAAMVDAVHAAFMATWIVGLPLLFWHRWPSLSRAYGVYAVVFVVLTQLSHWLLGECFLTTVARRFWKAAAPAGTDTDEWFTVRFAKLVFGLTPSHRLIAVGSEVLILATAIGALISLHEHALGKLGRRQRGPGEDELVASRGFIRRTNRESLRAKGSSRA